MTASDTNLLVYAHRRWAPQHARAVALLDRLAAEPGEWVIPYPCLTEFWFTVTRAAVEGRPSTAAQAEAFVRNLVTRGARIVYPSEGFAERLLTVAGQLGLTGRPIYDLHIALLALESGADRLWTHDRSFIRLPGLAVEDPLA